MDIFFYDSVYTKLKTNVKKNLQTYNSAPKTMYCVSRGKIKIKNPVKSKYKENENF